MAPIVCQDETYRLDRIRLSIDSVTSERARGFDGMAWRSKTLQLLAAIVFWCKCLYIRGMARDGIGKTEYTVITKRKTERYASFRNNGKINVLGFRILKSSFMSRFWQLIHFTASFKFNIWQFWIPIHSENAYNHEVNNMKLLKYKQTPVVRIYVYSCWTDQRYED